MKIKISKSQWDLLKCSQSDKLQPQDWILSAMNTGKQI